MPHHASEFDPERTAPRSQVRDLLERAIDNLPEPFRVVFMLRMVEQLSIKETACSLGLREETVKTRLHRARKLIRDQLHETLASALTKTTPLSGSPLRNLHRCAAGSTGRRKRAGPAGAGLADAVITHDAMEGDHDQPS